MYMYIHTYIYIYQDASLQLERALTQVVGMNARVLTPDPGWESISTREGVFTPLAWYMHTCSVISYGNLDPQRMEAAKGFASPTWLGPDRCPGSNVSLPGNADLHVGASRQGEGKSANTPEVKPARDEVCSVALFQGYSAHMRAICKGKNPIRACRREST